MIEVYSWPRPMATRSTSCWRSAACPIARTRWTSAPATSSSPSSWPSARTTRSRPSSTPTGPDGQPISLFESGAILLYLAGKTGRFLPADTRGKYEVLQWLMFQMGGVGPMLGQAHHFRIYAPEKIPYAIERYTNEAKRLYGVMNKRLAKSRYLGGPDYSIADIAVFPWLRSWKNQGIDWDDSPAPQRLVRRDRRTPRGQARRGGAGRPAQAHHGRPGARDPVRQATGRAALNPSARTCLLESRTHCP
jgi:GST-like protein